MLSMKYFGFTVKFWNSYLLCLTGKHRITHCVRAMGTVSRPKVFISRGDVDIAAINLLKKSCDVDLWDSHDTVPREELLSRVKGKDALFVLLTDKIDDEVLDSAGDSLKVIGTMSVGYDHIDVPAVKARNIKLGNTPDVLTDAVAELTLGLTLATARRFFESHQFLRSGEWSKSAWSPSLMCGAEIRNSVIGIIGLGRIGQALNKLLIPFKPAKVIYTGTKRKPTEEENGAIFESLDNLLKESDFVLTTCALNKNTEKLMNADAFNKMKSTAIFINVSRGGIVDHDALIDALNKKKIYAAGLDVMTPEPLPKDHPLTRAANLTLIPHIGSATVVTRREMALLTARNILAGLQNLPLPSPL